MADIETYLLKWDFDKFRDQISDVQSSYTKFGTSLRDLIAKSSDDLGGLQQKASSVSSTLGTVTPQIERSLQALKDGSASVNQLLESMARSGSRIASDVSRMSSAGGGASGAGPSMDKPEAQLEALQASAKIAMDMANDALVRMQGALQEIDKNKKLLKAEMTKAQKLLKAELDGVVSSAKGIIGNVPGVSSTIAGSLVGSMVLGVTETARVKALSGEVLNVFEATGEDMKSKAAQDTMQFFTGKDPTGKDSFIDNAQWFYGITKEESEGVIKSMVDAGYKSKSIGKEVNKDLGEVGTNLTTFSIGLDKMFEQSTGTSMNNIIKITSTLGDSLKSATHKYAELAFAGQRSGMGVEKFTNSVMSAASAAQQYGIDLRDVANVMGTVKKHYEDMGLSPQYAGDRAAQVTQGLMQAMANLNPGLKAKFMMQLEPGRYGTEQDAKQAFEDGFRRVLSGENKDFASGILQQMYKYMEGNSTTRAGAITVGMQQMQLGQVAAQGLMDTKGEFKKMNTLAELSPKELAALKNSLIDEGAKISDLVKIQRELTYAISAIGTGLLQVLVNLAGILIMGFKSIFVDIRAALPLADADDKKAAREAQAVMDELGSGASAGVDKISAGLSQIPGILEHVGDVTHMSDPLKKAIAFKAGRESGGAKFTGTFSHPIRTAKEIGDDVFKLVTDKDDRAIALEELKRWGAGNSRSPQHTVLNAQADEAAARRLGFTPKAVPAAKTFVMKKGKSDYLHDKPNLNKVRIPAAVSAAASINSKKTLLLHPNG